MANLPSGNRYYYLFIASTPLSHNMVLVTNNEKYVKRINGLKIENWS